MKEMFKKQNKTYIQIVRILDYSSTERLREDKHKAQ